MDNNFNNLNWLDWQIVVWVPLAIMTARELKKNWRQIFDEDLSTQDRQALQKLNIFFLIPLVVLLHEIGHSLAILWAGGRIHEFHFGIWWGYVVPEGHFTEEQNLIIYLAGSGIQIIAGFIALILAVVLRSPPMVALTVYLGLYSIAGTIIIYTLLSFAGMYGDWLEIYRSPLTDWVRNIAIVHVTMAAALIYLMYGTLPRLWYAGKTRPKWNKDYKRALERTKEDPSAINYLNLAWTYYFVGLDNLAQKSLDKAGEKDPNLLDRYMLQGWLKQGKGDTDGAIRNFEKIADTREADSMLRSRALMAIGHSLLAKSDKDTRGAEKPATGDYNHVLAAYEQAAAAEPKVADPRFYKATVLNKVGLHKEAEKELMQIRGLQWLDPALQELLTHELSVARKSDNAEQ